MDWFRSWHGAPTDTKWLLVGQRAKVAPGVVAALAWALMDYASKNNQRGSVEGFDAEEYCAFSQFDLTQVTAALAAMTEGSKPFIDRTTMTLTAWINRNPKSPDISTDRVRAHRERKRNETDETVPETEGNTDQIRPDLDQKEVKDPRSVPVTARAKGSFSFAGSGVGSGQGIGFDIRGSFSDADWNEITLAMRDYVHPSWDRKIVFEKYNGFVKDNPPKKPRAAFLAWLKKNARWLGKAP